MLNGGAYLHVMYAEDIRDEVDGKVSILGWNERKNTLKLPDKTPLFIPRLAIHGSLRIPEDVIISTLKIAIYFDDHLFTIQDVTEEINEDDLSKSQTIFKGKPLNPPMFSFNFVLGNLRLAATTVISVKAYVNEIEVTGNRLLVTNE